MEIIEQRGLLGLLVIIGSAVYQLIDVLQSDLAISARCAERLSHCRFGKHAGRQRRDLAAKIFLKLRDHVGKDCQLGSRGLGYRLNLPRSLDGLETTDVAVLSICSDSVNRCLSYSARRGVDDAQQCYFITRVDKDFQIREQVADLLSPVELHAANNLVRYSAANKCFFERPALGVHAVEHSYIVELGTLV